MPEPGGDTVAGLSAETASPPAPLLVVAAEVSGASVRWRQIAHPRGLGLGRTSDEFDMRWRLAPSFLLTAVDDMLPKCMRRGDMRPTSSAPPPPKEFMELAEKVRSMSADENIKKAQKAYRWSLQEAASHWDSSAASEVAKGRGRGRKAGRQARPVGAVILRTIELGRPSSSASP